MKTVKFTVISKKTTIELPSIAQPQSTKILNLSNVPLTQDETDILKLGLSFTPTPKHNIPELENDIFQFTKKLRLTYHYRNSNVVDESIFKLESNCKELEHTKKNWKRIRLSNWKIENKEIIIKPSEKDSIIVFMSPDYY